MQTFLQKTYSILKNEESFAKKFNLHIIQCDNEVREDVKITNQEEFDQYVNKMILKGFGGTDFRPVFEYVDRLLAERRFFNLKGLIYFTDGFGIFPSRKTPYETAFVFINNGIEPPDVPSWAIKIVLDKQEI